MAGKEPQASTPTETPSLSILSQYVRDMSFENVAMQKMMQIEERPDINVSVNVEARALNEGRREVAIKTRTEATSSKGVIFILEVDYVGLFSLRNIPTDGVDAVLLIECPRLLFPFLRRIIADITRDGGFAPLMIDPIDFATLYRKTLEARASARKAPAGGKTAGNGAANGNGKAD